MAEGTYTYRLRVVNEDSVVQAEVRDPRDIVTGEPHGILRYQEPYRSLVETLSQKALAGKNDKHVLTKEEIQNLGEALFNILFDDSLKTSFLTTYDQVVHNEEAGRLRVELDINEAVLPHLASLPWEFLRVPRNQITGPLWLATAPRLIFSRRRIRWKPPAPIALPKGEKLRLALAVAAPLDEELGPVDYKKLWQELTDLVDANQQQFTLLNLVEAATRDAIDRILAEKPHIFHFIGHGRLREQYGSHVGEIATVHESGIARWVDGSQFASLLNRHRPGIVVLQACEGAASDTAQAYTSAASEIVDQNIPVVVAMQYEISNATARRFTRRFYEQVAACTPVDEAVQEARIFISDWNESRDFATPVLFMRARHGHVFDIVCEEPRPDRNGDSEPKRADVIQPIHNRIREALLECGPFRSNDDVANLFSLDVRLAPWRYNVPQANNPISRVNAVMAYLNDRWNTQKENALALFLQALSDEKREGDICADRLRALARELEQQVSPPTW